MKRTNPLIIVALTWILGILAMMMGPNRANADNVWAQPPGTAAGRPNYIAPGVRDDIGRIYDGDENTWCNMDEAQYYYNFPYAYFGVVFDNAVEVHGAKFRNWLSKWNHITSFEVWALPPGVHENVEANWVVAVPQTSSVAQYGWITAPFASAMTAKQVRVRYLSIIGNWAASVGEVEFLVPEGSLSISPVSDFLFIRL